MDLFLSDKKGQEKQLIPYLEPLKTSEMVGWHLFESNFIEVELNTTF